MLNRTTFQKAVEVSFDRWYRQVQILRSVQWNQALVVNKVKLFAIDFGTRLSVGLGAPKDKHAEEESSLIGPAISTLLYALMICLGQLYVIMWVFATWLFGSLIVFLLFRMLGSSHSLLEVTSMIGYSMAPLTILEPIITLTEEPLPMLSFAIKLATIAWASRSASLGLIQPNTEKKTFLFACPLILFNVILLSMRTGA